MRMESRSGMVLAGENRRTRKKPVLVPFCRPQIRHGLAGARNRSSGFTGNLLPESWHGFKGEAAWKEATWKTCNGGIILKRILGKQVARNGSASSGSEICPVAMFWEWQCRAFWSYCRRICYFYYPIRHTWKVKGRTRRMEETIHLY